MEMNDVNDVNDCTHPDNAFYEALSRFQSKCPQVRYDKVNPHFRSKYASLASIWKTIGPLLDETGLCVVQVIEMIDGKTFLTTRLAHTSGRFCESHLPINIAQPPQRIGSELTYMRRYALSAILGLAADDDDDGEATENSAQPPASTDAPTAPAANKPPLTKTIRKDQLLALRKLIDSTATDEQAMLEFYLKGMIANPKLGNLTEDQANHAISSLDKRLKKQQSTELSSTASNSVNDFSLPANYGESHDRD